MNQRCFWPYTQKIRRYDNALQMFIPTRSAIFRLDLMAFEIQDNHTIESLNRFSFHRAYRLPSVRTRN